MLRCKIQYQDFAKLHLFGEERLEVGPKRAVMLSYDLSNSYRQPSQSKGHGPLQLSVTAASLANSFCLVRQYSLLPFEVTAKFTPDR